MPLAAHLFIGNLQVGIVLNSGYCTLLSDQYPTEKKSFHIVYFPACNVGGINSKIDSTRSILSKYPIQVSLYLVSLSDLILDLYKD